MPPWVNAISDLIGCMPTEEIFCRINQTKTITFSGPVVENAVEIKSQNSTQQPKNGCDSKPCFPFVECFNVKIAPFYQCGACPPGLTGNGINCTDIDEVLL